MDEVYSADVHLWLVASDLVLPVSKVGPDRFTLARFPPRSIDGERALLVVVVNGHHAGTPCKVHWDGDLGYTYDKFS